jgi:lysophospholipase L1-like esterase
MFLNKKAFKKIVTMVLVFFIFNILGDVMPAGKQLALAESVNYPGEEVFPVGKVLKFDFGTSTSAAADGYTKITTDSNYDTSLGYGWKNPANISITATDENTSDPLKGDYISGKNVRTVGANATSYISYDCPTFVADLPVGYYKVRLVQGSNTLDTCSGAYIEGSMNIVPWATDGFGTGFDVEPTQLITHSAGSYGDNTATVAVWDGQLTVQVAAPITPQGVSGTAIINALEIERIPHNLTSNPTPRIRSIGDSTVASYPPFDSTGGFAPIPEQTGWGGKLAMFFNGVTGDNWGVGGSSARYYIMQNYLNRFLLDLKPGDVVTVEWGINESAAGRRYIAATAAEFDPYIQTYIDAIKAYGGIPVLVSGTSGNVGYSDRLKAVAASNNVGYIDLKGLWASYKSARSTTQQGYLTVDGTHLSRVGGAIAGQLITYAMKSLTNPELAAINALNISTPVTAATVSPTAIPENLRVTKQTKSSVTFAWDMPEATLYELNQLITRFPIYRKAVGADDSTYIEVTEGTAYVTPDLTKPKLNLTISSTGDFVYAIASRGVNGTGPKSSGLTVSNYTETSTEVINSGIKYYNGLFSSDFTIQSYNTLTAAVDNGKAALSTGAGLDEAAAGITAGISGLKKKMETNLYDDFHKSTTLPSWETTPDPSGVNMTYNIDETGDMYLNYSVSASGERSRRKTFVPVTSNKSTVEFEWLPGNPDRRNVTELRFYGITGATATPANDLYFGLKTANNGHIGYYAGSTVPPINTSDILSPGVDLGLTNTNMYNVKIDFNFAKHTADLTIKPTNGTTESDTVVKDIAIPSNITTLSYMRWHAARGKNDTGGNDLSVLWNTSIDDFGYYYLPTNAVEGDTTNLSKALVEAKAIDKSIYTADSYAALVNAIKLGDKVANDFVIVQEDVDYAIAALSNATKGLVEAPLADTYKLDFGTGAVASDYNAVTSASLKTEKNRYGFVGTGMSDFDRATSDALTADGVSVPANTEFDILLPNKDYNVTVTYGDPSEATNAGTTTNVTTSDSVAYSANFNTIKKAAANISANTVRTDTFTASVFNGILRIIFTGTNIKVNSITVTPIADRTPDATPTLYLIGDSTVTSSSGNATGPDSSGNTVTKRFVGWGKNIGNNLTGITVSNKAVAGRGIRGFYSENRMDPIFSTIKPGDYVAIQFGHNDANTASAGRYSTISEFKEYLAYTCDAIRARGATPILNTVLTHIRDFNENNPSISTGYTNAPYTSDSQIKRVFPAYAQATRDVAAEKGVACYDLNEESYKLFLEKGVDWVKENIITVDGVHPIDNNGSAYLARMVADGLAALNISGLSDKVLANNTELQDAVNAGNAYNLFKYTNESAARLKAALDTANALLADSNARQTSSVKAIADIKAAIDGLVLDTFVATLTGDSSTILRTKSEQLKLSVSRINQANIDLSNATILYRSTNPSIADVNENGIVTAYKPGVVDITAMVTLNGTVIQSAPFTINVQQITMDEVQLIVDSKQASKNKIVIEAGEETTVSLKANGAKNLYGFDMKLSYDPNIFELISVTPNAEFTDSIDKVYFDSKDNNGKIRILSTKFGPTEGVTGDINLVDVKLRARTKNLVTGSTNCLASLTIEKGAVLSNKETAEYTTKEDTSLAVAVADADLTGGGYSIGDIVSVASAFGSKTGVAGYAERLDMDKDGLIDIADISYVAIKVLNVK